MRCACGAWLVDPHGQLAGDRVEVGDRAAGFQRRRVRARVDQVRADHHVGGGEDRVGGRLVARAPVEDVVAVRQVLPDHRRARFEGGRRVGQGRQRLVVDRDQLQRIPGRVPVRGHHEGDLLALETHLVGGQHGLHVTEQRGHPRQVPFGQISAGQHRGHGRVGAGRAGVDRDDPGVRERAAQDRAVQHAGPRDVVDERALAPDEPGVLLARDRPVSVAHRRRPASCLAAHSTDLTMFSYPVQRQTWPEIASRTSASGRVRVAVQQPPRGHHHARRAEPALQPVAGREALLHRVEPGPPLARPSTVGPGARPP